MHSKINQPSLIRLNDKYFFLQTHVTFVGKITPDQQYFQGVIKGFNIYSCIYAPDKRESTKQLVTYLL